MGPAGDVEADPVADSRLLEEVADELNLDRSSCEVVRDQFPAQAIVQVAQRADVEAVCMATYAHGVVPHTLGGVADEVVHDTTTPIVLVGPSVRGDAIWPIDRPLVVALDGSVAAASALPLAARWSARLGVQTHIATVHRPQTPGCEPARMAEAQATVARNNPRVAVHHLEGSDVTGTLLDLADTVQAGLLVLAPTGHGGAMNRALGFVATDLVQRSPLPVVVQRPDGTVR